VTDSGKFSLEAAKAKALEIAQALGPHCERLEVAGSIRRGKPRVKDIDLVVIPKMKSKGSLFGSTCHVAETDFYEAARKFLFAMTAEGPRLLRGTALTECPNQIAVDIYIATAESWATLLLIRTGSAEHNIWMCARARTCGGKLHADGSGLEVPGQYDPIAQRTVNNQVLRPKTEEEIFKALGIPTPAPDQRECANGRPVWMRGATA
jgi:DNA polymerase/3'-5' exonuclease PolX